ncbi:APC family permease, partial [Mycolicibacterium sp.]
FQRHNSIGVLFDTMGVVGANGSYLGAFLLASLVGLFLFYGFEACGDVAEEVTSPSREIPKAMIWTVVVGFMSAFLAFIGFILAAPNLQAILDGEIADPVSAILDAVMGHFWSKVFLAIALTAIMSCVLSLQAALSRLIFAFARDKMLPGHAALSKLTRDKTPRNALLLASLAPMVLGVWVFIYPSSLPRVTAFGVIGIYVCFQMVVLAALRQRVKGWKPAGKFSLGALGPVLNVVALLYGIAGIVVLALPGDADLAFADRWVVLLGLATVIVMGAVYLVIAKPYRHSDEPEGDAVEVAQAIRSGKIRLS